MWLWVLSFSVIAQASPKVSEFCQLSLPPVQAPFNCTAERESAQTTESLLVAYRAACPGLQERFAEIDRRRQKLNLRCVVFNTRKKSEPKECEGERVSVADSFAAYGQETSGLLDQVDRVLSSTGQSRSDDAICRIYHDQHMQLLQQARDRLHGLKRATERAEKESRFAPSSGGDRDRLAKP